MKLKNDKLTIGALAEQSGVGVETVRFYERQGLVKKPGKPIKGYRQYSPEDFKRIRFIKRAQELGFTLRETKELLEINTKPSATCADIKAKGQMKMKEIEAKIQDLMRMQKSLKELIHACGDGKQAVAQCRVMNCFDLDCDC
jgi:Hg(II)-responsive transcriptional regulator